MAAILATVFGGIGFAQLCFFGWAFGLAAMILGMVSLARLRRDPYLTGQAMAVIGIGLGAVPVIWTVACTVALLAATRNTVNMLGDVARTATQPEPLLRPDDPDAMPVATPSLTSGTDVVIHWKSDTGGQLIGELENHTSRTLKNVYVRASIASPRIRSGFYVGDTESLTHPMPVWHYEGQETHTEPNGGVMTESVNSRSIPPGERGGFTLLGATQGNIRSVSVYRADPNAAASPLEVLSVETDIEPH
jgi:hypothetical protein